MKTILKYLTIALAVLAFASCSDKPVEVQPDPTFPVTPTNINGTWELSEWNGSKLPDGRYFYIEFIRRGQLYKSYENTSSAEVHKETGEYNILTDETLGGSVILGRFDNAMGAEWNNRYLVTELTADRMVWTVVGNPDDVTVYTRIDAIPAEIAGEKAE